jgi:hypothetical protein
VATLPSSFSVAIDARRRACVLDTPLALSPYGLLLAQRLSGELDLWLVRELWQILDNTHHYAARPDLLLGVPASRAPEEASDSPPARRLRETLGQWDAARTRTDLAGLKLHWVGDAVRESLLPPSADPDLVPRFELLASGLERRHPTREEDSILVDCFRDAVALTAALTPHRAFLLTTEGVAAAEKPEAAEPVLCAHLRAWGIRCHRLARAAETRMERELLVPVLARAGVAELMWAGLRLAVVHVVVPKAAIVPAATGFDEAFSRALAAEDDPEPVDWWDGAVSFWYSLSPD